MNVWHLSQSIINQSIIRTDSLCLHLSKEKRSHFEKAFSEVEFEVECAAPSKKISLRTCKTDTNKIRSDLIMTLNQVELISLLVQNLNCMIMWLFQEPF